MKLSNYTFTDLVVLEPEWTSPEAKQIFETMQRELAKAVEEGARDALYGGAQRRTDYLRRALTDFYSQHTRPRAHGVVITEGPIT